MIFENIGDDHVTVRWYAPIQPGNIDFTYQVGYKLSGTTDYKWLDEVASTANTQRIEWLADDSKYTVVVRTLTQMEGYGGSLSSAVTVTTQKRAMDTEFPKTAVTIVLLFFVLVLGILLST